MAALISIIVPVYNVAPYLGRCLQSIVAQGLDDWEALLVNDASRDNSLAICNEWARREPRFRVVSHDKNKGLSEARNTGLRLATGKYIAFVDSDDSLTPNTLSEAMRAIEGAEVVEFPVVQGYLSKHA
nr:glycosyltransferase [Bacteroidaceae bacterium]